MSWLDVQSLEELKRASDLRREMPSLPSLSLTLNTWNGVRDLYEEHPLLFSASAQNQNWNEDEQIICFFRVKVENETSFAQTVQSKTNIITIDLT